MFGLILPVALTPACLLEGQSREEGANGFAYTKCKLFFKKTHHLNTHVIMKHARRNYYCNNNVEKMSSMSVTK